MARTPADDQVARSPTITDPDALGDVQDFTRQRFATRADEDAALIDFDLCIGVGMNRRKAYRLTLSDNLAQRSLFALWKAGRTIQGR